MRYIEDLERHVERLESALEANKKNFHVITPGEKYVITEPYTMVDKLICSFSRNLNKIVLDAGKAESTWMEDEEFTYNTTISYNYIPRYEFIKYIIPVGTVFEIRCLEVKKRRKVNSEWDFVRTIVDHYPGLPEAKGKVLNFHRKQFSGIVAETYIEDTIDTDKV